MLSWIEAFDKDGNKNVFVGALLVMQIILFLLLDLERARITSDGKVGIGSELQMPLDIASTAPNISRLIR